MRHPVRFEMPGLPAEVVICEVGPRDGLQNEPGTVPVGVKLELIERLASSGLAMIEVTSLVRPDRVPQLADADELVSRLARRPGVRYPVLVPNPRGLERALRLGVQDIAVFASATESFAQANLGRSLPESMAAIAEVVGEAKRAGLWVRGYVSMCFGDPWEGAVGLDAVLEVVGRLFELGCAEVSVGDTIGVATPGHVEALLGALESRGLGPNGVAVHFHDTFGQALANTLAALGCGVRTVDASVGGLGGCPFAKSASGNLATEDLLWQLEGLGIATGVALEELVATGRWISGMLGRTSPSRTQAALAADLERNGVRRSREGRGGEGEVQA